MSRVPLLLRLKAQDNDLDKKKIKAQNFFDNNMMGDAYNLYGCLYSETGLDEYLIQIAWMQFFGVGVDANQIQAITLLKDRNSGSTYRALGMMYQSIGEYDKAHEQLKLSISKCCFSAYFSLGLLFEEVGKESEAIDVYIDGAKNGMLPCMRKLVLKGLNEDGRKFNEYLIGHPR